jgi:hypothetical protein
MLGMPDMPTRVELTDQELAELKELTKQSEAGAAVRTAMREYVRYVRRVRLKKLSGKVRMQDNWRALEQAELKNGPRKRGPRAR